MSYHNRPNILAAGLPDFTEKEGVVLPGQAICVVKGRPCNCANAPAICNLAARDPIFREALAELASEADASVSDSEGLLELVKQLSSGTLSATQVQEAEAELDQLEHDWAEDLMARDAWVTSLEEVSGGAIELGACTLRRAAN